jgi:hypothetical protein
MNAGLTGRSSSRRNSAIAKRRKVAIIANQSARQTIGPIFPEMSLFAITRGQFSMIDVINTLIDQAGPSHLSVWTWAIAAYEVDVIMGLMERRDVLSATLIVDYSVEGRSGDIVNEWRGRFGYDSVKDCRNHAKIARVWNDDFRFLARGSMNLNYNPRFEQFDLTEGGDDFDMVQELEASLPVLGPTATRQQADMVSGMTLAFEQSVLDIFRGKTTWAK